MISAIEEGVICNEELPEVSVYLLPSDSSKLKEVMKNGNILGVIKYSNQEKSNDFETLKDGYPELSVNMKVLLGDVYYEVWTSSKPVSYGSMGDLQYATDGFHHFLTVSIKEDNIGLKEAGKLAYDSIFEAIGRNNYPNISRIWNNIPNINEYANETERYTQFCHGRADSFQNNRSIYPAATGIGCRGDSVGIYAISTSKDINKYIENPNQTPAYKYPQKYGIKSPSFARATYTGYGPDKGKLYISGTASIIGHETVHVGDVRKQCETTIDNIKVLISEKNLYNYGINRGFTLEDLDCIKVYIKNEEDFETVRDICSKEFLPDKSIVYLKADVCRSDLLVEIEGVIMANRGKEQFDGAITFSEARKAKLGKWTLDMEMSKKNLKAGENLQFKLRINLSTNILNGFMNGSRLTPKSLLLLFTSERCFDSQGIHRIPLDEKMSTLLTPTGLAIEGGSSNAISKHTGSRYRNPIDEMFEIPLNELQKGYSDNFFWIEGKYEIPLPQDMPPGVYRIRLDFGISDGKNNFSLNHEEFGGRPENDDDISLVYSPPFTVSGQDVYGNWINAANIEKRLYWVLLNQYKSNGYQGVVAEEDKHNFALSNRNIVHDEVILPLYDERGNINTYNLEPVFATDLVDCQRNIPWNYHSGQLSIKVYDPDGNENDLGSAAFVENINGCATTGKTSFIQWKPHKYGQYKVIAKGWIEDIWGNRYYGGGTYEFWIAKRITFGTSTFMGMPFSVGYGYGAEIGFAPAVPADVTVKVDLYVGSDPNNVKTSTSQGKASSGGMFSTAYGMQKFVFDEPGEYHAKLRATYTDNEGHLWVCTLRHAGVIHTGKGPLIAHGKKLKECKDYLSPQQYGYPYNYGEVLLVPEDGYGANMIEPVLTYTISGREDKNDFEKVGASNVRIVASKDLCPHLYPEYITDWAYYYVGASCPGLSARFMVAEDGVYKPSWPVSATNFGGQIGASNTGSTLGTPYRLLGGVVLRKKNETPMYGDYISNAFIISKGSEARVIKAGEELLVGAKGAKFRYYIISHRPGLLYEQDYLFWPYLQMDPIVPAHINYTLTYPDGRKRTVQGSADSKLGYFMSPERFPLDQPGVYRINFESNWNGYKGSMPGMPKDGAYIFVYEKERPANFSYIKLNLRKQQKFDIEEGLIIEGVSSAKKVYYASITPGALVEQGEIPVENGRFKYHFSPEAANNNVPIYDIKNVVTGRKETGRIIHLTFFAQEEDGNGGIWHSYARVIIRGTMAFYTYDC